MTEKRKREKLAELNKRCEECRRLQGEPTFDHCNYHCTTGAEIHKLEFEGVNGWNHNHWKK